jgi:gamma-glutamylcyclotransferase
MSQLYFAYGSNMSSARLRERVPDARSLGRARLPGFRLAWNKPGRDGTGKANIVAAQSQVVWGVLYQFESSNWPLLDGIEGDYARERWDVQNLRGEQIDAHVYRWRGDPAAPDLAPLAWYRRHLLDGAREHDLPREVIEALERPLEESLPER